MGQRQSHSKYKSLKLPVYHWLEQVMETQKRVKRVMVTVFDSLKSSVFRGDSKQARERGLENVFRYDNLLHQMSRS